MGMFDYVRCEYPLPGGYVAEHGFQTKDADQTLSYLRITDDGRLQWEGSDLDEFQGEERRGGGVREVAYHGDMVFYAEQRYFVARFWRGRVRFIREVDEKATYFPRSFVDPFGAEGMGDAAPAFPWRDRSLDELGLIYWAMAWEDFGITEKIAAAHLASLNQHIAYVRQAGQVIGVPHLLLHNHDQSKFGVEEFPYYARNFFGDKADPAGWGAAWNHHENHNPHHWGHWISRTGKDAGKPLPMPRHYVQEMVADWHGAGRAYQGSWDISAWIAKQGPGFNLHDETERLIDEVMIGLGYFLTDNCMWSYMAGNKFHALFGEL